MVEVTTWRPRGLVICGPMRTVEVRPYRSEQPAEVARIPAWWIGFHRNIFVASRDWRGYPRPRLELTWNSGLKRLAEEGDFAYLRSWSLPLVWPIGFLWIQNHNPSRAWTGREWELLAIEYGFGYGRRRVFVHRP